ncbi:PH-like_domain superfamily [Hexamita inflata]|uniref:PH-like domain superfamily n=2 Tax=Hexamita inflata TaxID=28002 RepID=A0AA86TQL0_9EUKA|nr:PH-like domain superfamily [Hexamita inflata]
MASCPHFRSIHFALALTQLTRHISSDQMSNSEPVFCFTCLRSIKIELVKAHFDEFDQEHCVFLFKSGVLLCMKCDCSINSYDLKNVHFQNFIHKARQQFNCQMQPNLASFLEQKQLIAFVSDSENDRAHAQKLANKETAPLNNINIQCSKNSVLKYAFADKSDLSKQARTRTIQAARKTLSSPHISEMGTLDTSNAQKIIAPLLKMKESVRDKLFSVIDSNIPESNPLFDHVGLNSTVQAYFEVALTKPIKAYKISTKGQIQVRYVYLHSDELDLHELDFINKQTKYELLLPTRIDSPYLKHYLELFDEKNATKFKLKWSETNTPHKNDSFIDVTDVTEIINGRKTDIFRKFDEENKRKNVSFNEKLSISVKVGKEQIKQKLFNNKNRTLDLEFDDERDLKIFESSLRFIVGYLE